MFPFNSFYKAWFEGVENRWIKVWELFIYLYSCNIVNYYLLYDNNLDLNNNYIRSHDFLEIWNLFWVCSKRKYTKLKNDHFCDFIIMSPLMIIEMVGLPISMEYHQFFSFNIVQQNFFPWLTSIRVVNLECKLANSE